MRTLSHFILTDNYFGSVKSDMKEMKEKMTESCKLK